MSVRQGDTLIAYGDVPVDGSTVTSNANGSIQANGVKNKNTSVGAVGEIYDWVGTLQEYNDQSVATLHPEWICFITDDNQSVIVNYANRDASNFTNTGKETIATMGYPDVTRAIPLTPLASGSSYTAPENGWFFTIMAATGTAPHTYIRYSANQDDLFSFLDWKPSSGGGINVWCPVKTSETVTINYNNGTLTKVYFIPAFGQA